MINGIIAISVVLWKKHDKSGAQKIRFGIGAAIATLLYVAAQPWVAF
jgi:hypothetical protein